MGGVVSLMATEAAGMEEAGMETVMQAVKTVIEAAEREVVVEALMAAETEASDMEAEMRV